MTTTSKLWGGRFSGELDALMKRFQDSMPFDIRLWDVDIRGSVAYAHAIARAGIITTSELQTLLNGLSRVRSEFAGNAFMVQPGDEDIHTAVERRLTELVGDVGKKLHTGRSRNDQVATDLRLYTLEALNHVGVAARKLQRALTDQAEAHVDTLMPGYTHLQRAQPITFGHWCMAYVWMLQRDAERLRDCERRAGVIPLGSGGSAGNPFAIDRGAIAIELGRDREAISQNSLDGVSDRDFIAEFLFCGALIGAHISRLAEDLVLYSTAEFGFVQFSDAYSTGSSIMPQKKNPDSAELARGKAGRLFGNLINMLTLLKGSPLTYNKDFQEVQEPLFDTLDTLDLTLEVMSGAVRTMRVNADRMRAALDPAMLATDVAEYLVRKGVAFRDAHHLSGRAVALAEERHIGIDALSLEDWRNLSPYFSSDIVGVFDFGRSVNSRDVTGGTSARSVREQIGKARALMAQEG